MAEQKQYPSCDAFGNFTFITSSNYTVVDSETDILYFMREDGAHAYWGWTQE
jgi:hypothetical protein